MSHAEILDQVDKKMQEEELYDGEQRWIYDKILSHRKNKLGKYEVLILWDNESESWEPLNVMAEDDPIMMTRYAKDNDLLEVPGWKRFKRLASHEKKFIRMLKSSVRAMKRTGTVYKFGVQVPRNFAEAMELDKQNGNTLWLDAIVKELKQIADYKTFNDLGKGVMAPTGYKRIRVHMVFDMKFDLRRKARLVAGGHMTDPPKDSTYSGVVSIRSVKQCLLAAEMNDMEVHTADVGNAYLEAFTKEKVYFIAGPEFGEAVGHTLVIVKSLHRL
jgi:hypothetical protein